jgi:acetylornithine/succinyldiaminopimelate/putrescine aminotransferase
VDLAVRDGRSVCEGLLRRGVLATAAPDRTVRLSPPLMIDEDDLRWARRRRCHIRSRVSAVLPTRLRSAAVPISHSTSTDVAVRC